MTEEQIRQSAPNLMPHQWEPFNGDTFIAQKFLELRDKFGITAIVETGTCFGSTSIWLAQNFKKVFTFENTKKYYEIAINRFVGAGLMNIDCRMLDSVIGLNTLLLWVKRDKLLFFLDAHFYNNCPLLDELRIIEKYGIKPVIAVHDMKVPGRADLGFDTYKDIVYEWDYIKESIERIYGKDGFEVEYNDKAVGAMRGILYCYPKR